MRQALLRRRIMDNLFPPGAVKIEYLESTGTQWIDTDYMLSSPYSMRVILDFLVTAYNQGKNIFGSDDAFGINAFFQSNSSFGIYLCGEYVLQNVPISLDIRSVLDLYIPSGVNAGTLIYEDVIYTTTAKSHAQGYTPFYLYTQEPTYARASKLRIYTCKIYDNEVLVRDFIPVRVGQVGYLYDKVSGQLFGNQGTGDFILGPDV